MHHSSCSFSCKLLPWTHNVTENIDLTSLGFQQQLTTSDDGSTHCKCRQTRPTTSKLNGGVVPPLNLNNVIFDQPKVTSLVHIHIQAWLPPYIPCTLSSEIEQRHLVLGIKECIEHRDTSQEWAVSWIVETINMWVGVHNTDSIFVPHASGGCGSLWRTFVLQQCSPGKHEISPTNITRISGVDGSKP